MQPLEVSRSVVRDCHSLSTNVLTSDCQWQHVSIASAAAGNHDDSRLSLITLRELASCGALYCNRSWGPRASEQGGDRGIGPPLSGLGIIPPPTFCCNIGKKYQNLLRIA